MTLLYYLQMYSGIKFPFDATSNKIATRKLQLDRASVYFHQPEGPSPPSVKISESAPF
jgi:hypothetical protein